MQAEQASVTAAASDVPLFCYGTLRHPEIIRRILGRRLTGTAATLPGYDLRQVIRAPYPAVVAQAGASTAGCLYTAPLSPRDWRILDDYEGEGYERVQLPVECQGQRLTAWVYRLTPGWQHWISRHPWHYRHFLRTHLHHYLRAL